MKQKYRMAIIVLIIAVVTLLLVESVTFYEQVSLGDENNYPLSKIRKSGGIICRWNASSDTANTTIIWYKNGVQQENSTWAAPNLEESDDILPGQLSEEDTWNCTIIIINNSGHSIISSASIYIDYDPAVYINTGSYVQINQTFEIYEDSNYSLIWNTTASDAISFDVSAGLCDGNGVTEGTGTCEPTSSHLGTNTNTSGNYLVFFEYDYGDVGSPTTQKNRINFTIIPVNDAPTFTVANETINESTTWLEVISILDEEGNFPINFTVEVPLFCNYSTGMSNITLNCTPSPVNIGNFTINITATDNPPFNETYTLIPGNTTHNFTLTVLKVNHVPNITYVSNNNASQNQNYTLIINVTDLYDNNTINITITSNCGINNSWASLINTTTVTWDGENFTSYGRGIWNGTLNNSQVACRNITITATDEFGASNSTNVYLNISNVNDHPFIEQNSTSPSDLLNNYNIQNLTGYALATFVYQINATDPDLSVTYNSLYDNFNESLTYITNSTWLNKFLGNKTGLINITNVNLTLAVGNYSFLINVTDNGLVRYSNTTVMSLEILPNDPPTFNQTLNFTCFEYDVINYPTSCNINLDSYAYDPNEGAGDDVANFSDDSAIFNINNNGLLLFNASQTLVGIHSFNVTILDTRGSSNTTRMYLYINNTNNIPNITLIDTRMPPLGLYLNRSNNNIISITAIDLDEDLNETNISNRRYGYENLIFNWSSNNASLNDYISIDDANKNLIINTTKTNASGDTLGLGDYTINVSVTDYYNETDSYIYNFTIYNVTGPPVITHIYPYGTPNANETIFDWLNVTNTVGITYINVSENTTIYFNQTTTDEDYDNLSFRWFYDETEIFENSTINYESYVNMTAYNRSLNFSFGFFEADNVDYEIHNLTLVVIDGFDRSLNDTFIWNINVTNQNRKPVLNGPIPNITVEGSRNVDNKDLWTASMSYGFYDPDFDYDGSGMIELGESNYSLTYSIPIGAKGTLCEGYATVNVTAPYSYILDGGTNLSIMYGHGIKAVATLNGTCNVTFTASDGELTENSNVVFINATVIGSESPDLTEVTQRSGSRTVTVTETVTLPFPEEIEKPIPIKIILPDMVTVYENDTIDIPLRVTNTWNYTVYGVKLGYEINKSLNYSIKFQRTDFYQIEPGEFQKTLMTVSNYRVGQIYEITITANVTEPAYFDSAKVYLNSIEQSSTGAKVKTLIKFARDLLHQHKECQELGEILSEAEESAADGLYIKALEQLNSIINGCKYLISQEQQNIERPNRLRNIHIPINKEYFNYLLGLGIVILIGMGIYFIRRKD
ncbi:cadherin repeat domain-containing protein [archaeon]|nr:cadherin repeat domain-containing protein [archaeon]